MTQEQILEMAKEAGFDVAQWAINGGIEVVIYEEGPITEPLKRFAALVAAHERERCAKCAEDFMTRYEGAPMGIGEDIRSMK